VGAVRGGRPTVQALQRVAGRRGCGASMPGAEACACCEGSPRRRAGGKCRAREVTRPCRRPAARSQMLGRSNPQLRSGMWRLTACVHASMVNTSPAPAHTKQGLPGGRGGGAAGGRGGGPTHEAQLPRAAPAHTPFLASPPCRRTSTHRTHAHCLNATHGHFPAPSPSRSPCLSRVRPLAHHRMNRQAGLCKEGCGQDDAS
jgi:hypothetical protein